MTDPYGEIQDPSTSAQRLAELAAAHPELGPWIAAHPHAYPELQQWIATYAQQAAATMPAEPTPQAIGSSPFDAPAVSVSPDPFGTPAAAGSPFAPTTPASPFEPSAAASSPTGTASPYGSVGPERPGTRSRGKNRTGLVIGLVVGIVVALVLAGGGVWWFFASRLGGAPTPEAAFTTLVSGVASADPLTLYGSLAPSEVGLLKDPIEKILNAKPNDADKGVDIAKLLDDLRANVSITSKDLSFTTDDLADGVARVTWTGGEVVVDGDAGKIADAVMHAYEPTLRAQMDAGGYSSAEANSALAAQKKQLAESITLPYTLSPQIVEEHGNTPIALVMAKEGSGWYVSPMLTAADQLYRSATITGSAKTGFLSHTIVPAEKYASPEDAASGLTKAVLSGDLDQVAASLPLPERRLVSIYGSALPSESQEWYRTLVGNVDLKEARFSAAVDGDRARLSIDKLGIGMSQYSTNVGRDLTSTWTVKGTCANWSFQYASDDGYFSSGRYSWQSGRWVPNWTVQTNEGSGCLADIPGAKKLGADQLSIIAVKENGGWLVSPASTIGDAAAIYIDNYLRYYESGTLDELLR